MKNNIQKNVMVNVDELTRLAAYGGSDGTPQARVGVIVATKAVTKVTAVASKKLCAPVSMYITQKVTRAVSSSKG